jgi:hypothetical protein
MLPKKKARQRSGIERAPKRIWPRHRRHVRSHCCCVPGCAGGVSLCVAHHDEQHDKGAETFQRKYKIDLWKLAAEFTRTSPDQQMKDAMRANTEDAA